jgi:single-strand DNA-binding protein
MTIEVAFIGRPGRAPQMRTPDGGKPWASLSLAVGRGDDVQWVSVSAFNGLATALPSDLAAGEKLYVEGKVRLSRWTKDGVERSRLQVAASRIEVLGRIGRRRKPRRRKAAPGETNGEVSADVVGGHAPAPVEPHEIGK